MKLNEKQISRYSRHIIMSDVGVKGQKKILSGKVLIIGVGGLGSPVALYLAAAGIGTLGLIDDDKVDMTNLQRQVIHYTPDLGKPKVISAREKVSKINPDVNVITHQKRVNAENIMDIIKDYDFIIDGTDNFVSKFLINDACVFAEKSFSHGGILRFDGQTMTYTPGNCCYRCLFEGPPPQGSVPTCSQAGVLGSVAGILGTIQATEALKFIIGKGELLTNRILIFDSLIMNFRTINIERNSDCPLCGDNPSITELKESDQVICDL